MQPSGMQRPPARHEPFKNHARVPCRRPGSVTTPSEYMRLALAEAEAAAARGEVPVGAVLVDADADLIVARGGNRIEADADATAHAELLVMRTGCRLRRAPRLPACDLFVTLEPCTMCAAAIALVRIRRVYFGAYDPKGGGVEHGARVFQQPTCHHVPEVYGGLHESAAQTLLRRFFAERR